MRLKCIKLAGFKSFVDPTTVEFPSNLCAVVGPNGCGKSNIIDAVRWVMGESSAKNLRGESMTDVIFNGSGGRKPVGQASIELVFDNSDGSVGGEYARFSEISIKRKVTRDSQNLYFLNGEKCRRRDITDIFLGTGLGPRSYAIIEQGMISRLIEAKPEDLRVFIEEAAGISKYKERRKETESRMRRTAENMERLTDIREELERQLQHLQRQAASAEKYTAFRQEERLCRAQFHAMQWRELDKSILQYGEEIGRFELELEAALTRQTSYDAEMDKLFSRQGDVRDSCDKVQARYYALGAEKARCEEAIKGRKERQRQLADDLAITRENCIQAEMHMREDRQKLDLWQEELALISPELALVTETEEGSHQLLQQSEEEMQAWQLSWDEFNSTASHSRQKAEIQQSRIQHIEKVLERMGERIRRFDEELSALSAGPVEQEINELVEQIAEVDIQIDNDQEKLDELQVRIEQKRQASVVHSQRLDDLKTELQIKRGRYSALEALQQAALSASSDKVSEWLVRNGLAGNALLAEELRVAPGWEKAVETVLSGQLQSVCVEAIDPLADAFSLLGEGSLQLLERGSSLPAATGKATALLEKVSSGERLYGLLAGIQVAETLADALALRQQLAAHESVVTRDGLWMGQNWLRRLEENSAQSGIFQRKEEMELLQVQISSLEGEQKNYEESQERNTRELNAAERERDELQKQYKSRSQKQAELTSLLSGKKARVSQILGRKEEIQREIQESHGQYRHEQEGLAEARGILQEAIGEMEVDSGKRESLIRRREDLRNRLETAKQRSRSDRDRAHQLAMREQSLRTQVESVTFSIERVSKQVEQLVERRSVLERDLAEQSGPEEQLQLDLEALLDKSLVVEEELARARKLVESVEHEMREADRQRSLVLQEIERHRSNLERSRLAAQTLKVQRENLHRQLVDDEFDVARVLEELPPSASESEWSAELERIAQRIARLGPINLAAIDEYKVASERKNYLDAQNTDLQEALTTLEGAIRKIDRETRMRFKDTFDQINASVQELFPKVFGGGRAYLEMTGEDLLDTGIAIMAQPPGKRNSTIHLLSGGEKALTAIALVFSIFRLNPAPFCMLDEVDAPLDDANVGRYANMVKEMSSQVQFIYITHNKIAMEMAQQLLGVTMYEPGVSRMVTVDVDEAVELADS